jgi:polyisoprenoid-binding protein YceI
MRKPLIALGLAAAAAIPVLAQMPTTVPGAKDPSRVKAGSYTVDSAHTQVMWRVNHLGFNDYFGIFGDAKGTLTLDPAKPTAATVQIEIPIASVVTSNAELTDGTSAKISGDLTIKGVTKPVVLDAQFSGAGVGPMNKKDTIGFHAETKIKRSDFGISYGVPFVPDEVPLQISVAFEKA